MQVGFPFYFLGRCAQTQELTLDHLAYFFSARQAGPDRRNASNMLAMIPCFGKKESRPVPPFPNQYAGAFPINPGIEINTEAYISVAYFALSFITVLTIAFVQIRGGMLCCGQYAAKGNVEGRHTDAELRNDYGQCRVHVPPVEGTGELGNPLHRGGRQKVKRGWDVRRLKEKKKRKKRKKFCRGNLRWDGERHPSGKELPHEMRRFASRPRLDSPTTIVMSLNEITSHLTSRATLDDHPSAQTIPPAYNSSYNT